MSSAHLLRSSKTKGDIGCDRASGLFDDYLEYRLSNRDRQRLEAHIVHCPRCAKELRARPALEEHLRLALGASVQSVRLSANAGARIVRAAQKSVRRGIWLNRAMIAGRLFAGAASILLLVVGLFYLLGRAPLPWAQKALSPSQTTPLPPAQSAWDGVIEPGKLNPGETLALALSEGDANPQAETSVDPAHPSGSDQPVTYGLVFDPGQLQAGQPFTATLLVQNEQGQSLPVSQVNLDIEGPQRNYHFEMAVSNPLPAECASALRITPDSLAEAIQERYQVSPGEILKTPGVYTIRITLFQAAAAPGQ